MSGEGRVGWPRAAASAAVFRGEHVLLVARAKAGPMGGLWSLPGGHIEPGERAAEAARREVMEETGIAAEIVGRVDVHEALQHDGAGALLYHFVITVHAARWLAGEAEAATDAADARFVPLAELASYRLTPGAEALIHRARRRLTESG